MPEITVTIFNRNYRLAVTQGEEELIRECAQRVDSQIQQIRAGGKVISADQLAVLSALEIAYESEKAKTGENKSEVPDSEKEVLDSSNKTEITSKELNQKPQTVEDSEPLEEAEAILQIKELCLLCEKAILRNSTIGTLF